MTLKFKILSGILLFFYSAKSQVIFDYSQTFPDTSVSFGYTFNFNFNGHYLNNALLYQYYRTSSIDKKAALEAYQKMPTHFSFGGIWNQHLYSSFAVRQNLIYRAAVSVKMSDKQMFFGNLSKDVFALFTQGNEAFSGKTVAASEDQLQFLTYQQMELGIQADNGMGKKAGLFLGYLNANRWLYANLHNSSLYTSIWADTLVLNNKIELQQTSTPSNFYDTKGGGFSLSAYYRIDFYDYSADELNAHLTFQAADLGKIKFYSVYTLQAAKEWQYTGVNISNVFDFNTDISVYDSLGFYSSYQAKWVTLPAVFSVNYWQKYSSKWAVNIYGNYRTKAQYKPLLLFSAYRRFLNLLKTSIHIGYGGWGSLNLGLGAEATYKNLEISLQSFHLEGWLFKQTFGSNNLLINCKINI